MAALPIKVPAAVAAQLQAQADRLGRSRIALARTLLLQGLAQLPPEPPAPPLLRD
jgi:hypothetical protein